MIALNYAAMCLSPVTADPFEHLQVRHFVPETELKALTACLPNFTKGGSFPIDSLGLTGKARELMGELQGQTFRDIVANRFGLDLRKSPTMVTLRGQSREKDGRIHCDSTAKRVTVLLYLNSSSAAWAGQESCLRLLRSAGDIDDYAVEIPPVNGTLLVFPNSPTAWHGHRQFVGQRYVVQLNYMTDDNTARSELRRHRWSAMVKRLLPA